MMTRAELSLGSGIEEWKRTMASDGLFLRRAEDLRPVRLTRVWDCPTGPKSRVYREKLVPQENTSGTSSLCYCFDEEPSDLGIYY